MDSNEQHLLSQEVKKLHDAAVKSVAEYRELKKLEFLDLRSQIRWQETQTEAERRLGLHLWEENEFLKKHIRVLQLPRTPMTFVPLWELLAHLESKAFYRSCVCCGGLLLLYTQATTGRIQNSISTGHYFGKTPRSEGRNENDEDWECEKCYRKEWLKNSDHIRKRWHN